RDLRDRDGKRMTDAYLVTKLGAEYEWVPRVYERTSDYVHLSATHLLSVFTKEEKASGGSRFELLVSSEDKPLPEDIYLEACQAFMAATNILFEYVKGWTFAKDNPQLMEKIREEVARRRKESEGGG